MDYITSVFRDTRTSALTLGVGVVVITHSAMVLDLLPGDWHETQKKSHAYLNLAAAGSILYGIRAFG